MGNASLPDPPLSVAVHAVLAQVRNWLAVPGHRAALGALARDLYAPLVEQAREAVRLWAGRPAARAEDVVRASVYLVTCAACVELCREHADATDAGKVRMTAGHLAGGLNALALEAASFRNAMRRLAPALPSD